MGVVQFIVFCIFWLSGGYAIFLAGDMNLQWKRLKAINQPEWKEAADAEIGLLLCGALMLSFAYLVGR